MGHSKNNAGTTISPYLKKIDSSHISYSTLNSGWINTVYESQNFKKNMLENMTLGEGRISSMDENQNFKNENVGI